MQSSDKNPEKPKTTSYGDKCEARPNSTVVSTAEWWQWRKSTAVFFHWLCVWCQKQSPFFTQQGSASVPVFSDTACSLEYTLKSVLRKDTSIDLDLRLTSYYPRVQKKQPSDFVAATLECFCGLVHVLVSPLSNDISLGFACFFFQSHFIEHLLVATSHRRQLQCFLFHNYCDHPCRMAQLEEQLGRINQSCESRAGGIVQWEEPHCIVYRRLGFCCVEYCTGVGITQSQEGVKNASQEISLVLVNGRTLIPDDITQSNETVAIIYNIKSKHQRCEVM